MAQVFSRRFLLVFKLGTIFLGGAIVTSILVYRLNVRADAVQYDPIEQPVPFSHQHHVRDDGIDCRYCHVSVENSATAGIPPLATCMSCHAHLFTNQPPLAPLVKAYRNHGALQWNRIYALPDFVYFDHSIHVAKGIGCSSCHGRIDEMPLTRRVPTLNMQWCLACHRAPELFLRDQNEIYVMNWVPPPNQAVRGMQLRKSYQIRSAQELTDCSTCHR